MKRLTETISFDEGLELHLKRFDEVVSRLREIHADESFLNDEAREYTDALKEFVSVQDDIFKLKDVSMTVQALKIKDEE